LSKGEAEVSVRSYFTHVHHGDADEAADIVANRLGYLVCTADLSGFSHQNFRAICQLLNSIDTSELVSGKEYLTSVLTDAVSAGSADHFSFSLRAVEKLDAVDALALLVRIEEVYAEARAGTDLETSCRDVYEKMQTRRFL
jgi:hypothetical protein